MLIRKPFAKQQRKASWWDNLLAMVLVVGVWFYSKLERRPRLPSIEGWKKEKA